MAKQDLRPVYLNLFQIRFPVTAILSIMHRIMGVAMVISLPFLIYLLDLSLKNKAGFDEAIVILQHPWTLTVSVGLVWALVHHLLAGIRFLILDFEIGIEKTPARITAYVVNITAVIVTLFYVGMIL